jgi:hypothetical protein
VAVPDTLLNPFARGCVADRLDLAALQVGNDQVQALSSPVRIEQGLGLVEDPVICGGLGHGQRISPGHGAGQQEHDDRCEGST